MLLPVKVRAGNAGIKMVCVTPSIQTTRDRKESQSVGQLISSQLSTSTYVLITLVICLLINSSIYLRIDKNISTYLTDEIVRISTFLTDVFIYYATKNLIYKFR